MSQAQVQGQAASAAVPGRIWYFDLGSSHVTQTGLKLVTLGVSLQSVNGQVPLCLTVILSLKNNFIIIR